jgi:hypothetical protein
MRLIAGWQWLGGTNLDPNRHDWEIDQDGWETPGDEIRLDFLPIRN